MRVRAAQPQLPPNDGDIVRVHAPYAYAGHYGEDIVRVTETQPHRPRDHRPRNDADVVRLEAPRLGRHHVDMVRVDAPGPQPRPNQNDVVSIDGSNPLRPLNQNDVVSVDGSNPLRASNQNDVVSIDGSNPLQPHPMVVAAVAMCNRGNLSQQQVEQLLAAEPLVQLTPHQKA